LGSLFGPHVASVVHSRSGTGANLFGTLRTAPYTLVDVIAVWPLFSSVALTGALSNVLDVRDAQDANLLPLPGRQVFVAVEVMR
jgi:outer membrane receptor for ferrienterochelin and colicin